MEKPMKDNTFGYKICYLEKDGKRKRTYIVTNSYQLALMELNYCQRYPQRKRKTNNPIREPTWYILPVKTLREYNNLWRDCPF